MDNFYRENILDHFRNPRNFGKLKNPDLTYEEENTLCGDRIGMGIKIKNQSVRQAQDKNSKGKNIEEIKFWGEGCAISMATASMLTEEAKGLSVEEIKNLKKEKILKLLGIELTPTRLKCALLPLEVLHKTLALVKEE